MKLDIVPGWLGNLFVKSPGEARSTPPSSRRGKVPMGVKILVFLFLIAKVAWGVWGDRRAKLPDIPGLPPPSRPVVIATKPLSELRARLQLDLQRDHGAQTRCTRLGLYELGLVDTIESSSLRLLPSLIDRVLGHESSPVFYVAGSDTIFLSTKNHPSLPHEWVHALDDQHSDRMREAFATTTSLDRRIALRAVIEGTAIVLVGGEHQPLQLTDNFDLNSWTFAYTFGPSYVSTHAGNDSRAALELWPATTYEVLFLAPPQTRNEAWSDHPGSLLCEDELGVLALITAMSGAGASREETLLVARSWTGDRLEVRLTDGVRRTTWEVAFTQPEAAAVWRRTAKLNLHLTSSAQLLERIVDSPADRDPHPLKSLRAQ